MQIATRHLTSPVAANQLDAGAFFCENDHPWIGQALLLLSSLPQALFFSMNMATQDLTSPVAAIQLAAGDFFQWK